MGSILRSEEVATPGEQATDTHHFLGSFVAPHAAIAFFDLPAKDALTGIVGAIKRFPLGSLPLAIARQARPEIPAIPKEESETIRHTLVLPFLRRRGFQLASMQRFQFRNLLPLSARDQFA